MQDRINIEHVYKIFGNSPDRAKKMYEAGETKARIQEETGNVVAVADVSFDVKEGEIFVVMGLSGSGKSTLIRCINRIWDPTFGRVVIDGEDIMEYDEERLRELRRKRASMVFQHFALMPHKSVLENVAYGLKVQGVHAEERRERALHSLEMVGLKEWADYRPENLSGGMQQRVGLARALAADTDILLMDEAFSALDPLIRREMQDELINLQSELQKTIVFITHDLNEALKLGDRTAIMRDGSIVQIGTSEEIVASPATDYVFEFVRDVDRGRVITLGSIVRPSETLVAGRDSVRTAVARMRATDADHLVLVDRQRKPIGLVLERDVIRAARGHVNDLEQVAVKDFPVAHPDNLLMDVFHDAAAGAGHCVVVTDEDGHLKGTVDNLDILSHLSMEDTAAPPSADDNAGSGPAPQGQVPTSVSLDSTSQVVEEQESVSKGG